MSSPGDVIGTESCTDLRTNHDDSSIIPSNTGHRSFTAKVTTTNKQKKKVREYPPPLPSLGVEMKRYYTRDGRLIIKEEKTRRRRHDIFRADRSNGRLTLHFVQCEDRNDGVLDEEDVFQFEMDDDEDDEVGVGVGVEKKCKSGCCDEFEEDWVKP